MSKTKEETVQQWKESLAESARTAVEALAAITPIGKPAPSTDEASEILGHAILKIRELVRPAPKTVAALEEAAWYRRNGEANPPLNIPPTSEPIDPSAPKMVPGEKSPFTRCTLVNIPEIGIEFHQFYTEEYYHAVCYFHNKEGDQHVYEVTVRPFPNGEGEIGRWHANCMADGATKFILESKSKSIAIECALTAMRRYLVRGHRCAWRTARKLAKQQAYNSKAAEPLSPEEELAGTIKRQKEEVQA